MKKYQPVMDFPAHSKNAGAVTGLLWLMDSNVFERMNMATIVVFQAFTVESYINHLGFEAVGHWEEMERLPWKSKITILHKIVGADAEWGKDPLQFAGEIFKVRDKMAHGKPETVEGKFYTTEKEALTAFGTSAMEPDWYRKIDKDWVRKSRSRFDELMGYLAVLLGKSSGDYQCGGEGRVVET